MQCGFALAMQHGRHVLEAVLHSLGSLESTAVEGECSVAHAMLLLLCQLETAAELFTISEGAVADVAGLVPPDHLAAWLAACCDAVLALRPLGNQGAGHLRLAMSVCRPSARHNNSSQPHNCHSPGHALTAADDDRLLELLAAALFRLSISIGWGAHCSAVASNSSLAARCVQLLQPFLQSRSVVLR